LQILEEIDGDNAGAIACEREQYWISEMLGIGHPLTNVSGNTRPYVRANAGKLYRTFQKPNFSRDETRANTAKKLPAMTEDEELLTVEVVARRLKVNQKRIYKLIQSGELEATNIGGEGRNIYRIGLADFNRYLQSRKVRRDDRH
jgi:excisionase family DNA binding protein